MALAAYADFLTPEFDPISYANKVIQGTDIATSLAQLSIGIDSLNKQLQQQIILHNDDLLRQVTGIDELDDVLNLARGGLDTLQMSMNRLHDKIRDPYQQIVARTTQLERLQVATELLRQFIRYLYLSKRLRVHLQAGIQDISKAAQCLNEIDGLLKDSSLVSMDVVASERAWIDRAHHIVVGQADQMLLEGLGIAQNHADVGTALQVFYNLEQLALKVSNVLQTVHSQVASDLKKALDVKTLGTETKADTSPLKQVSALGGIRRVGEPPAGQAPSWASALWQRLEKLIDSFVVAGQQIILLERVLSRKRDPSTHALFLDEVLKILNTNGLITSFWTFLADTLEKELSHAIKHSAFLQTTFQNDYPKLLRLFHIFFQRINTILTTTAIPGTSGSLSVRVDDPASVEQQLIRKSLSVLETSYLSRSLSRMFDPINLAFPIGNAGTGAPASVSKAPTRTDVATIVKIMNSELEAVNFDPLLLHSVSRNVAKALKLFAVKSENTIDTQPSSFHITATSTPTEIQMRNIETLNALYILYDLVCGSNAGDNIWQRTEVVDAMQDALQSIQQLIQAIVEPLLQAMADLIEQKLSQMHREDFSGSAAAAVSKDLSKDAPEANSKYMKDVCSTIAHFHHVFLSRIDCGSDMKSWVNTLVSYVLVAFLRHLSIVRPLGEAGKLRMAADMAQIELGLQPLFQSTNQSLAGVGRPYRALRAFRPLLFLESSQVVAKHHRSDLELAVVAHHLICRASSELQLPHVRAGWTHSEYVAWLDTHTAEETQALLNNCLTAYAADVLHRGLKSYTPEYPILTKLLNQPESSE